VNELHAGQHLGEARTQWKPEEEMPLRFISAYMPDHSLQEYLVRRFASIDPTALVVNFYLEEFLEPLGTRLAVLEGGQVLTFDAEDSAVDAAAQIRSEFNASMEDAVDDLQGKCFQQVTGRLLEVLPDRTANLEEHREIVTGPMSFDYEPEYQ
jgi:hypothetical protein